MGKMLDVLYDKVQVPNAPTPNPAGITSVSPRRLTEREWATAPAVLRSTLPRNAMSVVEDPEAGIAEVRHTAPLRIRVNTGGYAEPFAWGGVKAHEMTHSWELTRKERPRGDLAYRNSDNRYDYGGIPGLQAVRAKGKTIDNFGSEQLGQIVEDYWNLNSAYMREAENGSLTQQDVEHFEEAKRTYEPFLRQMGVVPALWDKDSETINTKPPAPSLPSPNVTGIAESAPSIGVGTPVKLNKRR